MRYKQVVVGRQEHTGCQTASRSASYHHLAPSTSAFYSWLSEHCYIACLVAVPQEPCLHVSALLIAVPLSCSRTPPPACFRTTRDECQQQVSGFLCNKHQKFPTLDQARAYLAQQGVSVGESSTTTSYTAPPPPRRSHGSKPYDKPTSTNTTGRQAAWLQVGRAHDRSYPRREPVGRGVLGRRVQGQREGRLGRGNTVWWGANDPRYAIVRELKTTLHMKKPLLIETDSKYSINCLRKWMPKRLRNNFKSSTGEPVTNTPLIRYLCALLDQRAREGQKVHLQYVTGDAASKARTTVRTRARYAGSSPNATATPSLTAS
ncbi:hypothetical protein OH76DRAFT_310119 [Lentinus brumalis]|uniref:RNase H type-1 domain-containing protein n=1 Tax=Lentinus brumalis TaxID=2498619 RepID=A0A371CK96_9APHY|nr:hypothetical protein OH76DRAFT_310119 [Polyporus brumalis]